MAAGKDGELLERVDHRSGVAHHRLPGHQAGEADGHGHIEHRADNQRGDDADGQVALRVAALLGRGGDRVEADVGEEDDRPAGEHAAPAVGHEGMPVAGMDEADDGEDEDENGDELDATIMLLVLADSRMPRTRITVRIRTMRKAGMLKPKCQPGW
jgi:hypothetical protein